MIQQKGGIKCGISITRAFGIEKDRTSRADEDILGTDIAANQSSFFRLCA